MDDREPRRVIVGVSGSPGSLHALRRAVHEARRTDACLWSVIAWAPPGGEAVERRAPCPALMRICQDTALRGLRKSWDEAMGGIPTDLPVRLFAVRGHAGHGLVMLADREDDLLVVGAGSGGPLARLIRGSVSGYCVHNAGCAVLTVPPSALERQLAQHPLARRRILRQLTVHTP